MRNVRSLSKAPLSPALSPSDGEREKYGTKRPSPQPSPILDRIGAGGRGEGEERHNAPMHLGALPMPERIGAGGWGEREEHKDFCRRV
jgi:hypothetical protein